MTLIGYERVAVRPGCLGSQSGEGFCHLLIGRLGGRVGADRFLLTGRGGLAVHCHGAMGGDRRQRRGNGCCHRHGAKNRLRGKPRGESRRDFKHQGHVVT
ncbi:hypothetical protein NLM33_26655 [Bradyrhizobium sp. CCGUVB1N3]|uniref:hypothetical protein n=1 Tax=Bradyrhizobium sp. CCGUVB1N3 TaxID=2949629 RepID=UPI0020B230E6|nr:hypothetical protein [Bradyrhizobium sp. CCGUVB1N3]MCP3473902.1 hypothetical protein [Bradyrhizobium sp. CCGUVB1N3]